MYELRKAADALNISGQEAMEMAIKQAEVLRNQDLLQNMMGYTDDQRKLLSNIAQVGEDGRLKLSIDGDLIDLQKETAKVIGDLEKRQENAVQEPMTIAEEQLGCVRKYIVKHKVRSPSKAR